MKYIFIFAAMLMVGCEPLTEDSENAGVQTVQGTFTVEVDLTLSVEFSRTAIITREIGTGVPVTVTERRMIDGVVQELDRSGDLTLVSVTPGAAKVENNVITPMQYGEYVVDASVVDQDGNPHDVTIQIAVLEETQVLPDHTMSFNVSPSTIVTRETGLIVPIQVTATRYISETNSVVVVDDSEALVLETTGSDVAQASGNTVGTISPGEKTIQGTYTDFVAQSYPIEIRVVVLEEQEKTPSHTVSFAVSRTAIATTELGKRYFVEGTAYQYEGTTERVIARDVTSDIEIVSVCDGNVTIESNTVVTKGYGECHVDVRYTDEFGVPFFQTISVFIYDGRKASVPILLSSPNPALIGETVTWHNRTYDPEGLEFSSVITDTLGNIVHVGNDDFTETFNQAGTYFRTISVTNSAGVTSIGYGWVTVQKPEDARGAESWHTFAPDTLSERASQHRRILGDDACMFQTGPYTTCLEAFYWKASEVFDINFQIANPGGAWPQSIHIVAARIKVDEVNGTKEVWLYLGLSGNWQLNEMGLVEADGNRSLTDPKYFADADQAPWNRGDAERFTWVKVGTYPL